MIRKKKRIIPASLDQLETIGEWVAELFVQREIASDLVFLVQLAIHELCVNIIEHAYNNQGGTIELTMWLQADRFMAELRDQGKQFDPNAIDDPLLETAQERGYGLFLLHELLDVVNYTPIQGGNSWRLEKRLI